MNKLLGIKSEEILQNQNTVEYSQNFTLTKEIIVSFIHERAYILQNYYNLGHKKSWMIYSHFPTE